jgi:hypothetical protein
MTTLASLLVKMGMDSSAMTTGAAKAEGSLAKVGLSANAMGAVVPLAAAAAGAAVIKFAIDAVGAASDFNESVNKVKVVFSDQSDQVIKWSETMAGSFGIAQQAALESAGTFGNLFDAMGIANTAGTQMSETLVELAADLASFNNASPEDVLAAMQSGLTGQIRPLRQYGIEISTAALQQEALAEGITKSVTQMSLGEKVQLRYALILKQTGNAQGDFARTSEGLANQQRILKAQWEDLQVAIGTLLLPAVQDLIHYLNDLATVVLFVAGGFEDYDKKVQDAATHTGQFALSVAGTFTQFLTGNPVVKAASDVWGLFSHSQDEAVKAASRTEAQLKDLAGPIPVVSDAFERLATVHLPKVAKAFRDTRDALIEEIPALRGVATTYKDTFTLSPQELVKITASWARIAKTIASDLRDIADSDLKPRMREAIAALPPEMRNAWVEGSAKQRSAIEHSIQTTFSVQDQMPKLAKEALTGGATVGVSLTQGLVRGIVSGSPAVDAAARAVVLKAIAAARLAAEAQSPSKKMAELGLGLTEGLIQGLLKGENRLLSEAEKLMSKLQDKLSNMLSKASSFGQNIQSGFSSLFTIPETLPEGLNPLSFFQGQLGTARNFADTLKTLQTQGAGKGLISEIAGQGPSAIPFAQQLLQGGPELVQQVSKAYNDIASIAAKTADSLTNQFFGDKIADLRHDVRDQKDVLVDIRQNVKVLEKISNQLGSGDPRIAGDVVVKLDSQVLARITRDELLKLGNRNAGTGLNN